MRVKAYRVRDFAADEPTKTEEIPSPESTNSPGTILPNIAMFAGIVQDFEVVSSALRAFPYKSAMSLLGVMALLFITFKVGTRFGIIQASFKRKGT